MKWMYWVYKPIIWILLRLLFRVKVKGKRNLPKKGGFIIASNHQAHIDPFLISAFVRPFMRVTFIAKVELYQYKGVFGRIAKHFFNVVAVAIDRDDISQADKVITDMGLRLKNGSVIGIFSEKTRTDGKAIYRGTAGVFTLASESSVPVVPTSVTGSGKANPIDLTPKQSRRGFGKLWHRLTSWTRFISLGAPIVVEFGKPYLIEEVKTHDRIARIRLIRKRVRDLMERIAKLAGLPYIDRLAKRQKSSS